MKKKEAKIQTKTKLINTNINLNCNKFTVDLIYLFK